jgi:hypothetical protein
MLVEKIVQKKILLEHIVYHYCQVSLSEGYILLDLVGILGIGNRLLILISHYFYKHCVDLLKIRIETRHLLMKMH